VLALLLASSSGRGKDGVKEGETVSEGKTGTVFPLTPAMPGIQLARNGGHRSKLGRCRAVASPRKKYSL